MADQNPLIHDVVIAGPVPVGLFLACELRLAQLDVLVLERDDALHSPLKALPFGLRGLSAPTLDALYRRGLLEEIEAAQRSGDSLDATRPVAHWMQPQRRPGGHFAGIPFFPEDVDASKWPYRIPGPAGVSLAVTMQSLEAILAARADGLGAKLRRGTSVEHFEQTADTVKIWANGETLNARWLIGC